MKFRQGSDRTRARWAFVFAALLAVLAAIPALAAEPPATDSEDVLLPRSLEAQGDWLPNAQTVQEGIAKAEREEARREQQLESPEAAEERARSRQAFVDLDAKGAEALLRDAFAAQFKKLNRDPIRYLSGADEVRTLGDTAAAVLKDGDRALLDASVPVQAKDERGDLKPVDVSLESTPAGFRTVNALVEVRVGGSAADPVEVGGDGLAIAQAGARPASSSRRYGEQNAFQFEAFTDTDTLVSPTATGVEIFHLLRSQASPESFDYDLEVPEGAELRDFAGGAAVVKDGKRIAMVPSPTAVDAQGADVPVNLVVEGDSLTLQVPHRGRDTAYPALVDPILDVWNWIEGSGWDGLTNGAWQFAGATNWIWPGTGAPCYYTCYGRGLYLTAPTNNYPPNTYTHWTYSAPNASSYVENVNLAIFVRDEHGCASPPYNQPHDYAGYVDNNGAWQPWAGNPFMNGSELLHLLLADGSGSEEEGGEASASSPELAVNVMNGNLVYREKDIDVEGSAAVDLELERYYNSQLPDSESTEWGKGWTLAQTPDLEPEEGSAPSEGKLLDSSGALAEDVALPVKPEEAEFDAELQASLKKQSGGGYELTDETGEAATSIVFDEGGRTEERRTESDAMIDYEYEGGELSGIDVEDPGSAGNPTEEPEEAEQEEPQMTNPTPAFSSAFGSKGTGNGQLEIPGGLAVDPEGHIWVTDTQNKRVQEFAPNGEFLSKFGSAGAGNGQFNAPTGIAIDPEGDIWVSDAENDRVQKFSPEGEYLDAFGSAGPGNGELDRPEGIALDDNGNLWVADTANGRLQAFDPEGEFIRVVGSKGSGEGEFGEPAGIEIGPEGNIWVADPQNQRVAVFDAEGEFLLQFGSEGTGDGEFDGPAGVDVDERGNVWVADHENARIQRFDIEGVYVDQFGSPGSGEGQLKLARPLGIFATAAGEVLVSDNLNHRVQSWDLPEAEPGESEALPEDDPAVDIDVSEGLVTSVEGEEVGEHSYEHEGEELVAHEGPEGTTEYEYDGEGRMTKVTLASGTFAEISYENDGRVQSVTVDPGGEEAARTTEFAYSDEARRTTVIPPDASHVVYAIGDDGSVFKWWNTQEPPELDLSGTLYDNKNEEGKLFAGDYALKAEAYSSEGIASIEVVAAGATLVDDKHCEQDSQQEGLECVTPPPFLEWITETDSHAPGYLALEVIATDRLGESTSERFWVDIPETAPLAPGTPVPPKFSQISKFREDYGLEVVFPVKDETELNERIFDLITAWWNPHTPAGEVARASYARWGVPLRPADIAELEYREWFLRTNGAILDQWFEGSEPASYAGYFLDHRAGGVLHVGFTQTQQEELEVLQGALPLVAQERLAVFDQQPVFSLAALSQASDAIFESLASSEGLDAAMSDARVDMATNSVQLTTQSLPAAESSIASILGPGAPVTFTYDPSLPQVASGRFRNEGRMRAGDYIFSSTNECTAGFGAYRKRINPRTGARANDVNYLLTAGHCYDGDPFGGEFWRSIKVGAGAPKYWDKIGSVAMDSWHGGSGVRADAAAILFKGTKVVPRTIFTGLERPWGVRPARQAYVGNRVCFSGARSQNPPGCGDVIGRSKGVKAVDGRRRRGYWVEFDRQPQPGDSGGPVYMQDGSAIGLISLTDGLEVELGPIKVDLEKLALVEPLLHPPNMRKNWIPGILHEPEMKPLYIRTGPGP